MVYHSAMRLSHLYGGGTQRVLIQSDNNISGKAISARHRQTKNNSIYQVVFSYGRIQ
jgi:hypothetical protein